MPVRPDPTAHPFREPAAMPPGPAEPFLLVVEDVFTIAGRGTVVTGRVAAGRVRVGDVVDVVGLGGETVQTTVTGVEMFRKLLDEATVGDNVGLLLRNVARDAASRGRALVTPGTRTAHPAARVEVAREFAAGLPRDGAIQCTWHSLRFDAVARREEPSGADPETLRVVFRQPLAVATGDEIMLRVGSQEPGRAVVAAPLDET